jgi:PKD repeat protein
VTRRAHRANEHRRLLNRRPGSFPGRRLALLCALTLGGFGCSATLAGADPSSDILVTAAVYTSSGTSTDSVTLGALEANPGQCPTYQESNMNELGRQGWVDVPLVANNTWSLPTILPCLQTPVPLGSVKGGVTVINPDGAPQVGSDSQITPQDLASPSDFNNSAEYPVVQALGSANQYDRPWRGSPQGQLDYDFLDEVQASQDGQPAPIAIEVFEGPLLTVTANASRTTVPAGGSASFSATVTGADDSGLSYTWNFDGGAPNSTAAAPTAAFNAAGQYDVTVQVTDAAGGGGGAEIPITVGAPAPAATGTHKQNGAGKSRKSHSPTGPGKSSGNHAGGTAGQHKSQSTSTRTTSTSQTSTTPSSTTPSSAPESSTSTATTPTHSTAPARTTPSRPRTPHAPRRTSRITTPPPPPPVAGPLVAGELISDVTLLSPGASPLVHTAPALQASAPPARQAIRTSAVPALVSALVIALLLGLGARRELGGRRGRRGWRARRPGS